MAITQDKTATTAPLVDESLPPLEKKWRDGFAARQAEAMKERAEILKRNGLTDDTADAPGTTLPKGVADEGTPV